MRYGRLVIMAAAVVLAGCGGRYTGPRGTSSSATRTRADTTNPGGPNNPDTVGMGNVGGVSHGGPGLAPPDTTGTHGTTAPGSFPRTGTGGGTGGGSGQ